MAKVSAKEETAPVQADKEKKDVKVLSLRSGKVELQDGQVLTYRGTVMVSKETADWLIDSFKPMMQIV